jgi:hypothetical protein
VCYVADIGEIRNEQEVSVEKLERSRWEDNIKTNLNKYSVRMCTGFKYTRIESRDRLL